MRERRRHRRPNPPAAVPEPVGPEAIESSWLRMSSDESKPKVLYVCHNHPDVHPGGAEAYALELYEAMRASADFEPIFVARNQPAAAGGSRSDRAFGSAGTDPNQYFYATEFTDYDLLYGRLLNKATLSAFRDFLLTHRPDVVHFQHTIFFGYDTIRVTKNTLPDTPIVYTLHEFWPICHRIGQMVTTHGNELCHESSPQRCHECFPEISPQEFFMRKRFIQSHLSLVDLFLAPTEFLAERYVEWGIPREKIRHEQLGHLPVSRVVETIEERPRDRFGFFGQMNAFKGLDVLLKAMKILGDDFEGRLSIHGANLNLQEQSFQDEFMALIAQTNKTVSLVGRYEREDLDKLMAKIDWVVVPSIWWENFPLVIQEAFLFGRPVICSDIGGMAENVTDGVNGMHFRRGDPDSLAQAMQRAIQTPGLWDQLRAGIPDVYTMDDHVATLGGIYEELLAQRSPSRDDAQPTTTKETVANA